MGDTSMQDEGEGGFDDEIMDEEDGSEGEENFKKGKKAFKVKKPRNQVKKDDNIEMVSGKD
jgi:hypothetical protein